MKEFEAIAKLHDRESLSPKELWRLREYFDRMQDVGCLYPKEYYGDWMQDITDELRYRGCLIDGESRTIPPKALPSPKA